MFTKVTRNVILVGLGIGLSTAGCSRQDDAENNMATIQTVDPMTNITNDTMGNQMDMLNASDNAAGNAGDNASNAVSTTTGGMATDATNTVSGTRSSGPSDTRGTRGEAPPR